MKKLFYKSIFIIFAGLLVSTPVIVDAAWWDIWNSLESLLASALDILVLLYFSLSGAILWLSGILLDLTIGKLVVSMAKTVDGMAGIFTVWQMLRDLANMFLIFIILYIAIQTILGVGEYKKTMVKVVIVALFMNFSLFFTNIMVDTSNLLSTVFYKGIVGSEQCLGGGGGCLTYRVLSSLAIEKIPERDSGTYQIFSKEFALSFFAKIMGAIVISSTAIVFIISSAIIIKRFIVLILAMMFSSLAFASQILPKTEEFWHYWFNTVSKECISTPIYFLYLWIVFKIMESDFLKIESNLVTTIATSGDVDVKLMSSAAGLVMNYTIIIGLLAIAPLVAAKVGASGAGWAKSMSTSLNKKFGLGLAGRTAIKAGAGTIRGASQITRAPGGLLKGAGWVGSQIGLNKFGAGAKALGDKLNNNKTHQKFTNATSALSGFATRPIENIKVYGKTTEQYTKEEGFGATRAKVNKQYADDVKLEENKNEYVNAVGAYEKAVASGNAATIKTAEADLEKATQQIGKNITKIDSSIIKKGAHLLSKTQLDTIDKAEETEISKDTKKAIAKARKESLGKRIEQCITRNKTASPPTVTVNDPGELAKRIGGMGDEFAKLDYEILSTPEIISLADREQIKAIKNNPDLTVSQTQEIMEARTKKLSSELAARRDPNIIKQELAKMLPEDYGNIKMSDLQDPAIVPLLRLPALKAIMENTSQSDRVALRRVVDTHATGKTRTGSPIERKNFAKIKEWLDGDGVNF